MRLGRYEIRREIARSNDIVWEGFDAAMNRRVAVKELLFADNLTGAARRERIERFFREARAAGQLTHPNIVTIHEVAEDAGRYFIAMEFLEGQTLRQRMSAGGPLPVSEATRIASALADALEYAHRRGIVHRDIKPDNVHLLPGGQVKLTDFGIARILGEEQLTVAGQVFGTPSYMAPEQIRGGTVGPFTDVFSLGVLLWEMIAGRKPFPGDSVVTITYKIMNEATPPLPGAPPQVEAVIRRATAKDPGSRFAHAGLFRDALSPGSSPIPVSQNWARSGGGEPVEVVPGTMMYGQRTQLGVAPGLAPSAPQTSYQAPASVAYLPDPAIAERRRHLALNALAVVVVLGLGTGVFLAGRTALRNANLVQARTADVERLNAAVKLYNDKKYDEAAAAFQKLRRTGNLDALKYEAYCYRQLGQQAQERGDLETARRYFDQALALQPGDSAASRESVAAGLRLEAGATPPPSLATPEPARTTEFPKVPAPGTPDIDAQDFQRSNARSQQAAAAELSAGDAAWRQGNRQEAMNRWTQASVVGPGTPAALEANHRLIQFGGQ
jgi:serine/threonine-protein kinase